MSGPVKKVPTAAIPQKEIPTKARETKKAPENEIPEVDAKAVKSLLSSASSRIISAYPLGIPVGWTAGTLETLNNFVRYALSKNELFKDKPLAAEQTARAVCKAITRSPNLTAMFLKKMSSIS